MRLGRRGGRGGYLLQRQGRKSRGFLQGGSEIGLRCLLWGLGHLQAGTGLTGGLLGGDQGGGQSISQIMPKLFRAGSPNAPFFETVGSVKWILSVVLGILALGFTLLYRAGTGESAKASSGSNRR